jgi:hypothetical protein
MGQLIFLLSLTLGFSAQGQTLHERQIESVLIQLRPALYQTDCLESSPEGDTIAAAITSKRLRARDNQLTVLVDRTACHDLTSDKDGFRFTVRLVCRAGFRVAKDGVCRQGADEDGN